MIEKIDNIVIIIWFFDGMCVVEILVMIDLSGKMIVSYMFVIGYLLNNNVSI